MEEKENLKNQFEKSMMARYLIHVVGDVHQPLHASSFFDDEKFKNGDEGGNLFLINYSENITNLHKLFDSGIGSLSDSSQRPLNKTSLENLKKQARLFMKELPKNNLSEFYSNTNFSDWIEESHEIDQDFIYKNIKFNLTPSEEFINASLIIVKRRITLGGYRLAKLFKDIKLSYDSIKINFVEKNINEIKFLDFSN